MRLTRRTRTAGIVLATALVFVFVAVGVGTKSLKPFTGGFTCPITTESATRILGGPAEVTGGDQTCGASMEAAEPMASTTVTIIYNDEAPITSARSNMAGLGDEIVDRADIGGGAFEAYATETLPAEYEQPLLNGFLPSNGGASSVHILLGYRSYDESQARAMLRAFMTEAAK